MRAQFIAQLRKQISFLNRSCEAFDAGHHDEGIRIAVALRVLLRDTASSTSLLNHLGALKIQLLSTIEDRDAYYESLGPNVAVESSGGLYRFHLQPGIGLQVVAPLADSSFNIFMSISKWLKQIVSSSRDGIRSTREDLILGAANKDGGAHVDLQFGKKYEAVSQDGAAGHFLSTRGGISDSGPIVESHLVSMRQMGYEIVNSPDLQALYLET